MRIAFTLINSSKWTGGYNYLLNLFHSIDKFQRDKVTPVLFCGEDATEEDLQPFYAIDGFEIIRSPTFNVENKFGRFIRSLLLGRDTAALRLFRNYQIDVLFENANFYGWRFPISVIAWMPDFQHRHLREQFNFKDYWRREIGFQVQVASGRTVMLSSEDAKKDCELFYPSSINNTKVVRFSAPIPKRLLESHPENVLQKYQLPSKFFYLPNQFWKHKNHLVVIEAIGLLKRQGCEIVVAASGNQKDPRHPEYVSHLKERIETLGLHDNFRMLGLIPRQDVISLMRMSRAIINPSYFEGWSSTVEEARTLGAPMLLSDINVHKEQMGDEAIYFSPDDTVGLADILKENMLKKTSSIDINKYIVMSNVNTERFACDFVELAEHVFRKKSSIMMDIL
ncbi:MAG: glycosyltransferase [Methylophaga sp.]|nr:glycosyltransferase [Methylophaga sp.]